MTERKRPLPKGWKPPLYSFAVEEEERYESEEEIIDPHQAEILYLRMLEAWPFLAKRPIKMILGPDRKGLYLTFKLFKLNGRVHMTISGSNFLP